ncbi:MAG: metalloregulator ArsR/SmtB family transcription factor [Sphingomonas sp.]
MNQALGIFRALADSTRLRILALLRSMELSVGELAQVLGQSQPRVSRHVKILCDAGLAERRKEGSWVFVALGESGKTRPGARRARRLEGTRSLGGGGRGAARGGARRSRRGGRRMVRGACRRMGCDPLAPHRRKPGRGGDGQGARRRRQGRAPARRLIDIGTGTGRMLELFAPRAEHALGIDRSSEMLRLARAKLSEQGLANAELRQADLYALPLPDGGADAAILHHVLHFAQQPGAAIAEASRVLSPGGRLLIADFAPHEREELRTQDAHARLGFSDEQILGWFEVHGLAPVLIETLEGGELTVKLWLGRKTGEEEQRVRVA